ncbi:hypothetical protein ABKN59_007284 [Abortiporus biennis]
MDGIFGWNGKEKSRVEKVETSGLISPSFSALTEVQIRFEYEPAGTPGFVADPRTINKLSSISDALRHVHSQPGSQNPPSSKITYNGFCSTSRQPKFVP